MNPHRMVFTFAVLFALLLCTETALSTTFFVTTTADDGPGSLRVAIQDANANPGGDTIEFNIPDSGVQTIRPLSPLPAISEVVIINGYSQPGTQQNSQEVGNNATLLIDLDGTDAGSATNGLHITAIGCEVRGLVIHNFTRAGIRVEARSQFIAGNFIGTNNTGSVAQPNQDGILLVDSSDNIIGGGTLATRNVIVGGIRDTSTSGGFNVITGNYIGTNAAGTQVLSFGGIFLRTANNIIGGTIIPERNVLGMAGDGISLNGPTATGNVIIGNYIGVSADGMNRLINTMGFLVFPAGVAINGASGNRVGGSDADDGVEDGVVSSRNVIAGLGSGVLIDGQGGTAASGNVVRGNFIGTNAAGGPIPSGFIGTGVSVLAGAGAASSNFIGGPEAGAGNLIANCGTGVQIALAGASANRIQGNFIGTDASGAPFLGNDEGILLSGGPSDTLVGGPGSARNVIGMSSGNGITINDGAVRSTIQGNFIGVTPAGAAVPNAGAGIAITDSSSNLIGGVSGEGNLIQNNGGDGVSVSGASIDNGILGNAIFKNGTTGEHLGIDIGGNGLTPNDPGDADIGSNSLLNHPVITAISFSGGMVTINGSLNTHPNTFHRIEFFSTLLASSNRFSEGQQFLGSQNVITDPSGNVSFSFTAAVPAGPQIISATATSNNGETSEFGGMADRLLNISTRMPVQTGDNVLIGGFIITGNASKLLLLRGIGPSLAPFFGSAAMQDPTLELYQEGTLLMANNNWRDNQEAAIIATGIPPPHNNEAAIVRSLAPGAYTAVLRGNNNTTGIAVVEAYDLERGTDSLLANISTRGFVQTGDNIMIGGFIVGGESNRGTRVLVRGIGPSLTLIGVPNPLQDPTLELVNGSGTTLATNNNWRDTQEAAIQATTIPPSHNDEAAILASLTPGNYTVVLRGNNSTTGIGVVEAYNLQ